MLRQYKETVLVGVVVVCDADADVVRLISGFVWVMMGT